MNTTKQTQLVQGDYYGVDYKGGFIVPILMIVILAIGLWWFLKKRKSTK